MQEFIDLDVIKLLHLLWNIRERRKDCDHDLMMEDYLKVPIAANKKGVCLQNTSKSHSYHLKIWHLL